MEYLTRVFIWALALAAGGQTQGASHGFSEKNLEVTTTNGIVKGYLERSCRSQKQFAGFRGIPYAEPPVGALRFKDPLPKANWEGIWDGTFERAGCLEASITDAKNPGGVAASEDCLYLNVYTPNLRYLETKRGPLKAVMVFIHGGAFIMGSSSEEVSSPDFLVEKDVLLVTFNYRLGPFGFLTLQNEEVPGNAGLKDQNLVLKWVKNNIQNFGGDPKRITIFGESAGSASVNYHLLSQSSAGLFSSAIMQSGTSITPWAYSPPDISLKKALKLGAKFWCLQWNMKEFLQCLQKVPAEQLRSKQQKALTLEEIFSLRIIAFNPTIEPAVPGAFITVPPFDLLASGNFSKVPTIIGSNADEGLLIYPALREDQFGFLLGLLSLDLSRFAPYHFHLQPFSELANMVHKRISTFYFNGKAIDKSMLRKVFELVADSNFILPIQLTASLLADAQVPVFNYAFTYDGGYATFKALANMTIPGVCHGDDLGYLFFCPALHVQCGAQTSNIFSADELMVDKMTKLWTNFAKTGNPTPLSDAELRSAWRPFTPTDRNYLDIGVDLVPSDSLKLSNMLFWENLIKDILKGLKSVGAAEINASDTYRSQAMISLED